MLSKPLPFFVLSTIGIIVGWALRKSTELRFCFESEPTCINNLTHAGDAIFYGMGALAIVFLVLLFVPKAFSAWKKFAIWFVPLAALLFAWYPDPGSGDLFAPYPEQVFQWVSAAYVAISLAIIAFATFRKAKIP